MAIDLQTESLRSLTEAARLLPPARSNRPPHTSCLLRWILHGVNTRNGRVHLEAVRLGGRWLTSVEALQRFAEAQTPKPTDATPLPRTTTARQRASARAAKKLEHAGW
jgi:hypothetical protein